jgi:hypothetical protein
MEWNTKIIREGWELNKIRRRKAFLFFPKTIGTKTKWLQFAEW